MKCKYCGKKGSKRFCNDSCRSKDYYQKNKIKKRRYAKEYSQKNLYNLCKCGNKKFYVSKQCRKCHISNKYKFQLSKLPSLK